MQPHAPKLAAWCNVTNLNPRWEKVWRSLHYLFTPRVSVWLSRWCSWKTCHSWEWTTACLCGVASVVSSAPSPLLWTSVCYFFTSLLSSASCGLSDWRRRRNVEQYVRKGKRKERKSEGNEIFEKKGRRRERNVLSVWAVSCSRAGRFRQK